MGICTTILLIICISVIIIVSGWPYMDVLAEPWDYVWVPTNDNSYRQVPITLTTLSLPETSDNHCVNGTGCYMSGSDSIIIKQGWEHKRATLGCTVWTHEVLHAWGISHAEMEHWFNCDVSIHPLLLDNIPRNYYPR